MSLGYFNQNSSGYLLSTLTKDLSNFELVITHALPSIVKTVVMVTLVLIGTFFINWRLALAECVVLAVAFPILTWGNHLVERYGTKKRQLNTKMISIVLEYIKGMKVFKSHNMTSTHFSRMSDTLDAIRKTNVKTEVKMSALLIAFEHSYNLLKDLKLAADNLEKAYDTKPLPYKEENVKLKYFDVAFDHVDFSYNQQADVLHDICFHAKERNCLSG